MLKIDNIHVYYGAIHAVKGVSFEVGEGEIVALIGANGAGKSTILKTVSGLMHPRSGSITFMDKNITHTEAHKLVHQGLAHVPEGRRIFLQMSVMENIEMGAYAKRARAKEKENLEYVFNVFPELKSMLKQACGNLSGGQQQMVAIARSIMASPELLILDEPSIGLSPIATQKMFDAIELINKSGIGILITEQNVQQVLKMADTAYAMQQGKIALSGKASDIAADEELKKIYIGM
jgi:branched-chain amino acid transport system ATP-binding protein